MEMGYVFLIIIVLDKIVWSVILVVNYVRVGYWWGFCISEFWFIINIWIFYF